MRILLFFTLSLIGHIGLAESIATNPKIFYLSADGQHFVAEGSWKLVTRRPTVAIPQVNSFRIECSKSERVCREYVAKLIRPSDDPLNHVDRTALFMMLQQFTVEAWDENRILATAGPRAADVFLRIDLNARSAERESQETDKRGALGARTASDKWISK